MGYRIFTDRHGTEWQAWDIIPRLAERRARQRRAAVAAVEGERRAAERRVQQAERSVLSKGLHAGWLCFETRAEKRRLAPVPADWLRCAVAKLEEYLMQAVPAARVATGLDLPLLSRLDSRTG